MNDKLIKLSILCSKTDFCVACQRKSNDPGKGRHIEFWWWK